MWRISIRCKMENLQFKSLKTILKNKIPSRFSDRMATSLGILYENDGDLHSVHNKDLAAECKYLAMLAVAVDDDYNEGLRYSAKHGFVEGVYYFIKKSANDFDDAMILASSGGHLDIVKICLENDALVINESALEATINGHTDIVEYLLMIGADNIRDLLINATVRGYLEIVNACISLAPLQYKNMAMKLAAERGHVDIVTLLISMGANNFDTTMSAAARYGHIDIVKIFLDRGAPLHWINSAMMLAAGNRHRNIVFLCIGYGANNFDQVILHIGESDDRRMIRFFKEIKRYGRMVDLVDMIKFSDLEMIRLYTEYITTSKSFNDAMYKAIELNKTEIFIYLVSIGADDFEGAILFAVRKGRLSIVEHLIDIVDDDVHLRNAFKMAIYYSDMDIINLFIRKGIAFV